MNELDGKILISVKRAARLIDSSERHIYNLMYSGILESRKIRKSRRIVVESFRQLVASSNNNKLCATSSEGT